MTLLSVPEQATLQTTTTDDQGRFAFEPMAAGKYALMASRRGYLSEEFNEHENYSSAIVTGEGQDTEHIPFRLDRGGVVRGTVTDEKGDPVPEARVLITNWSSWNGFGDQMAKPITSVADDRGEFEVWNLRPLNRPSSRSAISRAISFAAGVEPIGQLIVNWIMPT